MDLMVHMTNVCCRSHIGSPESIIIQIMFFMYILMEVLYNIDLDAIFIRIWLLFTLLQEIK